MSLVKIETVLVGAIERAVACVVTENLETFETFRFLQLNVETDVIELGMGRPKLYNPCG